MKKVLISIMTVALFAALTAPVYAEFTPSAETKAAPEVVTDGGVAAVITSAASGATVKDVSGSELSITSIARKNQAPTAAIEQQLTQAELQIKNADELTDLTPDLRAALDAAKQEASAGNAIQNVRIDDLAVSDLFDVTYMLGGQKTSIGEGNKITFTVKTNLTKNDIFFVLHNYAGNEWEVVDDTELADNGDLTITADSLSPFAIVVDKTAYITVNPAGPNSPKTGEMTNYAYLASTVALLTCAAFLCMKGTKRTEA